MRQQNSNTKKIQSKASVVIAMLSLAGLLTTSLPQQANAFDFSDLDPTNPNSALNEGLTEIDPTNPNSALNEGLTEIDPTNPNSALNEGLTEIDPTNPNSALNEGLTKIDPTRIADTVIEDRINNAGENVNQQVEQIGDTALDYVLKIAIVIGGLASFLFLLSILGNLMKRKSA